MKTTKQKGFTLIELMLVVLIGTIVILAAGTILVAGHKSFNEAWRKANLQREASLVMLRMGQYIKAANSAELQADGNALKIYHEGDWTRFSLTANDKIAYETSSQAASSIINADIENLVFNIAGSRVTITLKLKDGNLQTQFVSTVMMRNYEE